MKYLSNRLNKLIHHLSKIERESIAAIAGMAIEYCTVFLYGFLAPLIIPHFFQSTGGLVIVFSMLLSYLVGPLGAIVCGTIGDMYGRKIILVWTLALVAIPTFLMALLPTYDQIGVYASISFFILKTIQMMAFSGDLVGLATFMLEDVPAKRRGFFGGLMSMGSAFGVLLASFLISIFDPLEDPYSQWKWRILLSIGIFGLFIAIYFQRIFSETETFKHYKKDAYINSWSFIDLFKYNALDYLKIIGITALVPIITIIIFGFIPYLGTHEVELSPKLSMWSNTISIALFAIFAPLFGHL